MRSHVWITAPPLALLLVLLLSGCDRAPTRPVLSTLPVRFTLTRSSESGDPAHPVSLHARVTNIGIRPIVYSTGCSGPAIRIAVWAPDRGNIVDPCIECPNVACPACADLILTLRPGESIENAVVFAGTLYHCDGPYAGPGGAYTVEAVFRAIDGGGSGQAEVVRAGEFTWTTAGPR